MGLIRYRVCPWQVFLAYCNVTIHLLVPNHKLQRKWRVVNYIMLLFEFFVLNWHFFNSVLFYMLVLVFKQLFTFFKELIKIREQTVIQKSKHSLLSIRRLISNLFFSRFRKASPPTCPSNSATDPSAKIISTAFAEEAVASKTHRGYRSIQSGNTKGESITVPLTSCLTGLE